MFSSNCCFLTCIQVSQVGVHKYVNNDCVDSKDGKRKGRMTERMTGWKEGESKGGWMGVLRSEDGRKDGQGLKGGGDKGQTTRAGKTEVWVRGRRGGRKERTTQNRWREGMSGCLGG